MATGLGLSTGLGLGLSEGVSGENLPTFHGLTFNPVTFELVGVLRGIGPLDNNNSSTRYFKGDEFWQEFGANEPGIVGAREVKYVALHSNDFSNPVWVVDGGGITAGVASLTFDGTATQRIRQTIASAGSGTFPVGGSVIITVEMKATLALVVGLSVNDSQAFNSYDTDLQVTLTTEFKPYTFAATHIGSDTGMDVTVGDLNKAGGTIGGITGTIEIRSFEVEVATGRSDLITPSESRPNTTAAKTVRFANSNDNTVLADVVTRVIGAALSQAPGFVGGPQLTNDQIESQNLNDVEYTSVNMTTAFISDGVTGVALTATRLTATAANATVIANAITDASDNQTARFQIQRITGTGEIDITVDGGSTWQDVTTEVDSSAGFNEAVESLTALANPQIGVRIVTSADAVDVGNAEAHLGKTESEVRETTLIFTSAAPSSTNADVLSLPISNHAASKGGYFVEWTPQAATSELSGNIEIISLNAGADLLFYDADNSLLKSFDGTNTASVALVVVAGTTVKIWVSYGNNMQVGVDLVAGSQTSFDGEFTLGSEISLIRATTFAQELRELHIIRVEDVAFLQALAA